MKHFFLIALISLSVFMANTRLGFCLQSNAPTAAQNTPVLNPRAEKIAIQVIKFGVDQDVTVSTGKKEYHGAISKIEDESFQLAEVDLNQVLTISYDEVKKIRKGYGEKNMIGKRVNPRTGTIIGIAVIAGIIALAFIGASQTR